VPKYQTNHFSQNQKRPATTNNVRRLEKYVQNILKNQNNQEISSFRKSSKSNDNSHQILSFCDEQTSQNVSKTLNVFSNCDKVNFRCRLSGYSLFFLWCRVTNDHDLVYTLSNNCRLHQATTHMQIIHIRWDNLSCVAHCLKDLFVRKQQHRHRQKTISRYRRALCTTVLGLFSCLKILGIFSLTAHIGSKPANSNPHPGWCPVEGFVRPSFGFCCSRSVLYTDNLSLFWQPWIWHLGRQ